MMDDTQLTSHDDVFILHFESWEGPIEALLELAKAQKVDLSQINLLDLISQFDAVIGKALSLRIELAADWLVMAAWLTYLKSRILLRKQASKDRPIEDDDVLAYHLKRLNAVKTIAEKLPNGLVLGRDWFGPSGAFEQSVKAKSLTTDFHLFLRSYPNPRSASDDTLIAEQPDLKPFDLASVDAALTYLAQSMPEQWVNLLELIPYADGVRLRSNIASTLIASLEMSRDGHADVNQANIDGDILVRRKKHS